MGTAAFPAVAGFICLISSVLHAVQTQTMYLQGSPDLFVDPFGVIILSCQINPAELTGTGRYFVQWRSRVASTGEESTLVTFNSDTGIGFNSQEGITKLIPEPSTGRFDLKIGNTTYEAHDGDYYCEISLPERNGIKGRNLRTKIAHLYVKYQPQPPVVSFSPSANSLEENHKLVISCSSQGGNPPPQITWLRGTQILTNVINTPAANRAGFSKADLVLNLTKEDNGAVFTCKVMNPSLNTPLDKSTDPLNVKYKPRVKVGGFVGGVQDVPSSTPGLLAVEAGVEAKLTCSVDANPPVALPFWRKNGQVFSQSSFNYTFTQGTLTRDSAGEYSCVASNGVGSEEEGRIKVDVFYAPVVSVTPSVMALREGANGALQCKVDSNPKPVSIEWYRANGDRLAATEEVLSLSDVKRPEGGVYECRVKVVFEMSNGVKATREGRGSAKIDVQYRPGDAIIDPVAPRATVGNVISLRCSAPDAGLPAAQFRWRKLDGRNGIAASGQYFNLTDAKLDDNGDYECTPFNEIGEGTPKVITVEVSEAVSWTSDNAFQPTIVRKISEKPMSLSCAARGRPAPSFVWLKDGVQIPEDDKFYKVATAEPGIVDRYSFVTRSELQFEGPARTELFSSNDTLQRTDRGRYQCKAINDAGQPIVHESHLQIMYPPEFVNRHSHIATDVSPQASAKLECLVESNPEPTITWSRNNQPIQSFTGRLRVEAVQNISAETYKIVLTIDQPDESDLGEYQCSAKNLIGDNSKTFNLVRRSIPEPARNLKQKDLAYNAVTLTWDSGFDGGYPQKFTVVMTRPDGSGQEYPIGSDVSEYRVTGLVPMNSYTFKLRSENQLGHSKGTSENIDIITPVKPVLPEDIPFPSSLKYDASSGTVNFAVKESPKVQELCAMVEVLKANTWTPISRCVPLKNNQGSYRIAGPAQPQQVRLRYCAYNSQTVCGPFVDENTVLQQASTAAAPRLDIILPIVLILALGLVSCMIFIMCRRRSRRTPIKVAKTSNLTLASTGSSQHENDAGFYADGYADKHLHETGGQIYASHASAKLPPTYMDNSPYSNGLLYSQAAGNYNQSLMETNNHYKPHMMDHNGAVYSTGNTYMQSYPSYDEGYGHQHSPLESNYTQMPVEVNGLPDPYEEYEKTPSFGEESLESGYSTSNSRGRKVIREIIV
ncbi:hypothetical protein RvY_01275 [Ramazzottius varieornatus]|uniref:Uncharacterized protein n=1 Tax=Ramazzottius varieornatus TaxID=947166 RepID=A0A1D1UJP3_RAMVA|nr:hypothetical protein RvY_01275 [Ramazzottius varieornatus]